MVPAGWINDPDTRIGGPQDRFPETRPSLLAEGGAPEARQRALEGVIAVYWKPVYKYIRRTWNRSNEDAKDLTQAFFSSLLERDLIARFDQSRASFRTYLRVCIDGFVENEREAASRWKRGGGLAPLDFEAAEAELARSAARGSSPEEQFHREWQREVLALAIEDLRADCAAPGGRAVPFRIFEQYDLAESRAGRPSYEALAREHNLPVTQVTNYLAWARRELRARVAARLERVTASQPELERELVAVFRP